MFEFGFSFSSDLFSGPGLLAEGPRSAVRVFACVCALAATPASAVVANAEPMPSRFLLDTAFESSGDSVLFLNICVLIKQSSGQESTRRGNTHSAWFIPLEESPRSTEE